MATTTNYGWTTPDDTALVKDGASAIRTLGSSVDTTTKNLNPETTLGDISFRSSTSNVNTRLGIGTTGQVLNVSGGVPAWTTISTGGMTLLSTTTLSGVTTTISSISQDYTNLYAIVTGMTGNTGNAEFEFISNNSGNLFDWSGTRSGVSITNSNTSTNVPLSTFENTLRTNADNAWAIEIFNYTSSTRYKPITYTGFFVTSTSVNATINVGGVFRSNTAITSLVFKYGGTNTFAGGTVLLYGVK